jgi:hypothetical protein
MATTVIKDGKIFRVNPKNSRQLQWSNDKGLNWVWTSHIYGFDVNELMVDGNDLIAVCGDGKMRISHDNGVNWPIVR